MVKIKVIVKTKVMVKTKFIVKTKVIVKIKVINLFIYQNYSQTAHYLLLNIKLPCA